MDPFSIVVGVGSLLQMSIQLGKCIKSVYEVVASFEEGIKSLMRDVQDLDSVNKSLKSLYETDTGKSIAEQPELPCQEVDAWKNTMEILQECVKTVERLQVMIGEITKSRRGQATRRRDVVIKHLRKQAREGELNKIQFKLSTLRGRLSVSLTLLSL